MSELFMSRQDDHGSDAFSGTPADYRFTHGKRLQQSRVRFGYHRQLLYIALAIDFPRGYPSRKETDIHKVRHENGGVREITTA